MPMQNLPHAGLGLRDEIEALDWTVAEGAAPLGVGRLQPYTVINGKIAIAPGMAIRLEKSIGSTAEHWLRLLAAYTLAQAFLQASAIKVGKPTLKVTGYA